MKKRIWLLALTVVCMAIFLCIATSAAVWDGTAASGFASGSGSASDPYIIKTAGQLAYLAQSVNAGTDYSGEYIRLDADILLNDTADWERWDKTAPKNTWTPIGSYTSSSNKKPFCGDFDGNGHTVSGIYIQTASDCQGLFGYTDSGANIHDLGVTDSYISGGSNVGGVVGVNWDGIVTNCYNTGSVTGSNIVGGVVGVNYAYDGTGTVTNGYNTGSVTGSGNAVGGVVGCNGFATVTNCYNTGSVTGSGNAVGGVVGCNGSATVTNCYNTGSVTGSGNYVGGVVGRNYAYDSSATATVKNCYYLDTCIATTNEYGTALTDTQMRQKASFSGFDFADVWEIGAAKNYPYPTLRGLLPDVPEVPEITVVKLTVGSSTGYINDAAYPLDAAPIIRNSRTMLPVRFLAEAFGAQVGWDGATSTATVTASGVDVRITVGANEAIINGVSTSLDSPAFIENGRTYLPVRVITDALGAAVEWDGATSTATLTK